MNKKDLTIFIDNLYDPWWEAVSEPLCISALYGLCDAYFWKQPVGGRSYGWELGVILADPLHRVTFNVYLLNKYIIMSSVKTLRQSPINITKQHRPRTPPPHVIIGQT